jgi:hypothetical protein
VPLSVTGHSAYGIRGTRSAREAVDEVSTNDSKLAALTGRAPAWFRPGTAYYDDVAVDIVRELDQRPLGFSVNGDRGATASAASLRSTVAHAAPGSIVIAHMNHPESGTAAVCQPTGDTTEVSSSEIIHSRRCAAVSWEAALEATTFGWPRCSANPSGP